MSLALYGLITGIAFGFFLQKGGVLRFDKQIGALRLMDMTIVKFMFTTVVVSMVGVYFFKDLGLVELKFLPTVAGGNIIGGIVFGIGWAAVGYCPGTSFGALGEGRWDSVWAIMGMVAGAAFFAEAYPAIKGSLLSWGDFGYITLPEVLGVNHWPVIAVFAVGAVWLFAWFEKKGL